MQVRQRSSASTCSGFGCEGQSVVLLARIPLRMMAQKKLPKNGPKTAKIWNSENLSAVLSTKSVSLGYVLCWAKSEPNGPKRRFEFRRAVEPLDSNSGGLLSH